MIKFDTKRLRLLNLMNIANHPESNEMSKTITATRKFGRRAFPMLAALVLVAGYGVSGAAAFWLGAALRM